MTIIKLGAQRDARREAKTAFFDQLYRETTPNPIGRGVVYESAALLDIQPWEMGAHISEIRALKLREGSGTRALKLLLWLADEYGIVLTLNALRIGKEGMTSAQLRKWYRKYGFTSEPHNPTFMQRQPVKETK